jgi:hypothetical protein
LLLLREGVGIELKPKRAVKRRAFLIILDEK